VGIVNNKGEVIEGGFQEGVGPLLEETERTRNVRELLIKYGITPKF
jgi:hypothetical protein